MARPTSGRRLHAASFDQFLADRGTTAARLAQDTDISQSQISDMRSGRRLVTPPVWKQLAEALCVNPEAILWPVTAIDSTRSAA